jgi:hypothetical protein
MGDHFLKMNKINFFYLFGKVIQKILQYKITKTNFIDSKKIINLPIKCQNKKFFFTLSIYL